jgi:hypothetical protein
MPGRLTDFLAASERRQAVNKASVELAPLAPSLAAEMAPLFLLWHSHLPVWQMWAIMAASWAFTWRLTWTLALAMKGMANARLTPTRLWL